MKCDFGCGQEATHQFKNGKWCCSNFVSKCQKMREKNGVGNKNKYQKGQHPNCGKIPWNKGISRTEEEKTKISRRTKEEMNKPENRKRLKQNRPCFKIEKHPNWKGGYYSKNIPLYNTYAERISYAEECRKNELDSNILEVKCAYCGKWFIPTITQVYERVRTLNGKNYGEQRLYCSDSCKYSCPIFHQILYPKDFKISTSREVQPELRQLRFKIDSYTCQKCKRNEHVELHCHHIEGIRWEPLESADIDKVITLCKGCHIKTHNKEGCSYYDMQCKDF